MTAPDFLADLWPSDFDDRRSYEDEPQDPEPEPGWSPPRRPVYARGLHANPSEFPTEPLDD